jgi:hypothetical protein
MNFRPPGRAGTRRAANEGGERREAERGTTEQVTDER